MKRWSRIVEPFAARILTQLDVIREEEKPTFFGPGPSHVADYKSGANGNSSHVVGMDEHEAFSPDREWMPRVGFAGEIDLRLARSINQKIWAPYL